MLVVYSEAHQAHAPPHLMTDGVLTPSFETPTRASIIHTALERSGLGVMVPPRHFDDASIRAVHTQEYLDFLAHAYQRWVAAGGSPEAVLPDTFAVRWMNRRCEHPLAAPGYYASDLSAPIVAGTYGAARVAATLALTGAELLIEGQQAVYALCRPPGHHAGQDLYGGFCFLNNAAIATERLLQEASAQASLGKGRGPVKVAILDIDFHHGNGTQQIFYKRSDVLFISIHADPARHYPYFSGYSDECGVGSGLGYTLNFPLEAGVTNQRFLDVLAEALHVVQTAGPDFLVLSAGLDTYVDDPLGDFALTTEVYPTIGQRIAALNIPTLIVQEGGYAIDALGENVIGLLRGFG